MRNLIFIAAALMIFAAPAARAQELELGPGGVRVEPFGGDHWRGGDWNRHDWRMRECRRARWHCLHKDELGEEGEGNCARMRRVCRGVW